MTLAEITVFAQLLNNDNLHPQTIDMINDDLRTMIGEYRLNTAEVPDQPKHNPFNKTVFDEWMSNPDLDTPIKT